MRTSQSKPLYYLPTPIRPSKNLTPRLLSVNSPKFYVKPKSPAIQKTQTAEPYTETPNLKGLTILELENQRREKDLNQKLYQTIELKLRKSEVFNQLFAKFMEVYKMYEIQEFNRKVDENMQSNYMSQLNVYKKLKLFTNTMKDQRVEFICFKAMIRSRPITIVEFIRPECKKLSDLNDLLRLKTINLNTYKDIYFITLGELETALQLRNVIQERLKGGVATPSPKESFLINKGAAQRLSDAPKVKIRILEDKSKSKLRMMRVSALPKGLSSINSLVDSINTEIDNKKQFVALRKYIRGIITNTESLKTMPIEIDELKTKNETLNEKYHRSNLVKRIVKTNLVFYLMMQIDNKQGFIKLSDQLEFV